MQETAAAPNPHTLLRWATALVVILTLLAGALLVSQLYQLAAHFGDVVNLYFAAWVLQFLLAPLVDWLCARGVGRGIAAGIVYLGIIAVAAGLLIWTLPFILTQLQSFAGWLVGLSRQDIPTITRNVELFVRAHAPQSLQAPLIDAVRNISRQLQEQAKQLSANVLSVARSLTTNLALQSFSLLNTTLTYLFNLLIILILSFFMTVQGRQFVRGARAYLPRSLDPDVDAVLDVVNRAFGGFIRGQLLLSTIYAVLIFAILELFARLGGGGGQLEKFAAIGAILAGLIMIIPVIGTTVSMLPPLVIGALALQDWGRTLWLLAALWVVQIFMANILGPRVMSDSVGVNAILSFGALLIGGKLGGILGAFFAVPMLAVALAIAERAYLHLARHLPPEHPEQPLPTTQRRPHAPSARVRGALPADPFRALLRLGRRLRRTAGG